MIKKISLIIPFLLLQTLLAQQLTPGDINSDGKIDSADIARGVQIALGQAPPATQAEIEAGDMNRDGRITVQDLVFIRNTIAGGNRPPVADASASPDSGLAGTDIQLNGTNSFDLDGDALSFHWRQLHMNRYSTEYMTENQAVLSDSTSATPTFNPVWPGNYRFELQVAESAGLANQDTVNVWVTKAGVRQLGKKGILLGDVFGELGGPQFDVTPDDPDSLAAVQRRAMDVAVRTGAGWVGIVPAAFYERIVPLPVIRPDGNDLSLTNEVDYAAIVAAAHARGMKVIHEEQVAPGFNLRPGELDSLDIMRNMPAWWDQWFTEWENYLLPRVDLAQKYGVEMFSLMLGAEETFRPTVFPEYGNRWRQIINKVRQRYSGFITMTVFNADQLNFGDALDALQIFIFPLEYTGSGRLADVRNPTVSEIRSITEDFFNGHEANVSGQVPVYFHFGAVSADGQVETEPPPPISELDNREQVIYYEAFFQALEDESWINGFFVERSDWFDKLDHPGLFSDNMTSASPRNKPAEKLIKLWFGIY